MTAIRPEIHLSLFGRKKKVAPEAPSTEETIDNTIHAVQGVAVNTVAIAEEAVGRLGVKLLIGAVLGGVVLIVVNTAGNILANALDTNTD